MFPVWQALMGMTGADMSVFDRVKSGDFKIRFAQLTSFMKEEDFLDFISKYPFSKKTIRNMTAMHKTTALDVKWIEEGMDIPTYKQFADYLNIELPPLPETMKEAGLDSKTYISQGYVGAELGIQMRKDFAKIIADKG